ncbi:MAG: hypothetical protein Q7R45_05880, partial [Sulfuricaulis sp.]|nr:hypothetical protein [Sulfuricaulis sp.]
GYLAAIFDSDVSTFGVEQRFVNFFLACGMRENLAVLDLKVFAEFRVLDEHPLIAILFFDLAEPHDRGLLPV